jgi:hypothetical protein
LWFVWASTFSRASLDRLRLRDPETAHDPGRLDLTSLDLVTDGASRPTEHPGDLLRRQEVVHVRFGKLDDAFALLPALVL